MGAVNRPSENFSNSMERALASGFGFQQMIELTRRALPTTPQRRRTLNIALLAGVIPALLLSIALVNLFATAEPAAAAATDTDVDRTVRAVERVVERHSQTIDSIAADPTVQGVSANRSATAARLESFLDVYSEFESLALLNAAGEPIVTAGDFPTDFQQWQEVPAFQESLDQSTAPAVSPLNLEAPTPTGLDLDATAPAPVEHLAIAAPSGRSGASATARRVLVGIIKSETVLGSVHKLLYRNPGDMRVSGALAQQAIGSLDLPVRRPSLQMVSFSRLQPVSASTILRPVQPAGAAAPWQVAFQFPGSYSGTWTSLDDLSLALAVLAVLIAILAGWSILRSTEGSAAPRPGYAYAAVRATGTDSPGTSPDASRRLVEAQESIRREMADYLHGHVQSKLLAVSMYMGICQRMVERNPRDASQIMERIQDELRRVQDEDLRQVSRELYPAIIKMGLVPALRSLVSRFSDLLEIDLSFDQRIIDLDAAGEAGLTEKRRLGIYRIAEEALNNTMKHGNSRHVQVSVVQDDNCLVLSVIDDGRGFEAAGLDHSHGLMLMRDYAEAIGGQTHITSMTRVGTTVRLTLSMPPHASLSAMLGRADNTVPSQPAL